MEKLTIQQIAPYIPYGLEGNYLLSDVVPTYKDELRGKKLTLDNVDFFIKYATPILHPISCLTKTIQHEGREFIPIVELAKIAFPDRYWEIDGNGVAKAEYIDDPIQFWYSHMVKGFCNNWKPYTPNQYQLFQKLAEWHINFVGIPEGLYIDKNTLK